MNTKVLLSAMALTLSVAANAETQTANEGIWDWNLKIGNVSIDSEAAAKVGVEDSAMSFEVAGDYVQNNYRTSLFAQYIAYDDLQSFTNVVIGSGWSNKGDISSKESDASGLLLGVAFGPQWQLDEQQTVIGYAQAGADFMVRSERSIASCSDCYSEDIKLEGGFFVAAGIEKRIDDLRLALVARQHLSGDLASNISLVVGYHF